MLIYIQNKVFRQKDSRFINILNELRCGMVSDKTRKYLIKKCEEDLNRVLTVEVTDEEQNDETKGEVRDDDTQQDGIEPKQKRIQVLSATKLFSVNRDVDEINNKEIGHLREEELVTFSAFDFGEEPFLTQLKQGIKASENITLCKGAQVMLLRNLDTTNGLVNGTRGTVVGFESNSASRYEKVPLVEFYCTIGDKTVLQKVLAIESEWTIEIDRE